MTRVLLLSPSMAESTMNQGTSGGEEDYMGDLSQFLPPESSKSSSTKVPDGKQKIMQPSKRKSKTLNWQEQRKLERERRQQEEDQQTLAKIEAPIPQSNIGFKLLKQMGFTPGSSLGKEGKGRADPVALDIRRSRAGIGREDPYKEKRKRKEMETERMRMKEEAMMAEFGSRQKSQWRSRRVIVNFHKAKAALDQLENREVLPEKEDEEESDQEEEEEEVITEEDLRDILLKLREHRYCLFCGVQYESTEELSSNCPGTDEDEH